MRKQLIVAGLSLALLAVCAGSVVASLPVLRQIQEGKIHWSFFSLNNIKAESDEEKQAAVTGPASLKISTPSGKIEITAKAGASEIVIQAHKTAWGTSKQDAEALLQKVTVIVKQDGNSVDISVKSPIEVDFFHIGPSGATVDFTITVPPECAVDASSDSGDIALQGTTGNATLRSNFGLVRAGQIHGDLTAHSDSGDVEVDTIVAAGGSVEVTNNFGDIQIRNVDAGSLTAHTDSGDMTVNNSTISGKAEFASNFGEVHATSVKAGSINARNSSGNVILNGLEAGTDLTAHSSFGDILVKTSSAARYDLTTDSGDVTAEDTRGMVKAHSNFGAVSVSGENVILDLSTDSGSVIFAGSLGEGTSVLHSNFGNIRISLPADAQCDIDFSTNFGSIKSDFPVTATTFESTHLEGKVGAGGPMLKASTDSGDVELRILPAGTNS